MESRPSYLITPGSVKKIDSTSVATASISYGVNLSESLHLCFESESGGNDEAKAYQRIMSVIKLGEHHIARTALASPNPMKPELAKPLDEYKKWRESVTADPSLLSWDQLCDMSNKASGILNYRPTLAELRAQANALDADDLKFEERELLASKNIAAEVRRFCVLLTVHAFFVSRMGWQYYNVH